MNRIIEVCQFDAKYDKIVLFYSCFMINSVNFALFQVKTGIAYTITQ